jgi:hypothetical protein
MFVAFVYGRSTQREGWFGLPQQFPLRRGTLREAKQGDVIMTANLHQEGCYE